MKVAALVCPGRGSYGQRELGAIAARLRPGPVAEALAAADDARARSGRPTITELDAAARFRPGLHLAGENAAELIYFATLAHAEQLFASQEIVAVAGNSLGWYSALAVAGVLTPHDGWRLVATMARLQDSVAGGQIITTFADEQWRADEDARAAIVETLAETNARGREHFVAPSIRLGHHAVLAGTELGIQHLLEALPERKLGERSFPFRLAGHGPFHTMLCMPVAEAASEELRDLQAQRPRVHLIDGVGNLHTPWSADPAALLDYTTHRQVVTTYDFTAAIRTALREFCPDVVLCAAPGESLRAPIGHVAIAEGYRGLVGREALFAGGLVA
jgi:malonyl CoA-acyl carrier protein transacylase